MYFSYNTFLLICRDRLIANDFIQIRKVAEHVYDKVLGSGSDSGSVAGGGNTVSGGSPAGDRANTDSNADNSSLAEEKVELLCNDQLLEPSMDLRTVLKTILPNEFQLYITNTNFIVDFRFATLFGKVLQT